MRIELNERDASGADAAHRVIQIAAACGLIACALVGRLLGVL
jgi:hypothetical protein